MKHGTATAQRSQDGLRVSAAQNAWNDTSNCGLSGCQTQIKPGEAFLLEELTKMRLGLVDQGCEFFTQYPADSPPHHGSASAEPPHAVTSLLPSGLPRRQLPADAQGPNFHTQLPLSQDGGLPIALEGLVPQAGAAQGPGPSQSPVQWTLGTGGGGSKTVRDGLLTQLQWSQEAAAQVGSPPRGVPSVVIAESYCPLLPCQSPSVMGVGQSCSREGRREAEKFGLDGGCGSRGRHQ